MKRSLLVVVLVLACAAPAAADTIVAGGAANGKTVKAKRGDLIDVALASNPSTGYSWELRSLRGGIGLYTIDYVAKKRPPGVVGVGGTIHFRFVARVRGAASLELVEVAPGTGKVAERYRLTVTVT